MSDTTGQIRKPLLFGH